MTEKKNVCIGSFAVAIPTYSGAQVYAKEFIKRHYGHKLTSRNLSILDSIFSHPSISKRHFALDDPNTPVKPSPSWSVAPKASLPSP